MTKNIQIGETWLCQNLQQRVDLNNKEAIITSFYIHPSTMRLSEGAGRTVYICRFPDGKLCDINECYLIQQITPKSKAERFAIRSKDTWNKSNYVKAHPEQAY